MLDRITLITGTKGKTIVTHLTDFLLRSAGINTMRVDSTGSYFRDIRQTDFDDSLKNFGFSPNISPGRYIYWNLKQSAELGEEQLWPVLESSLGSAKHGTGLDRYGSHSIGILTNIYKDHVNQRTIHNEEDIYAKKSFIFRELRPEGLFISTPDNPFGRRSLLEPVLAEKNARKTGVSLQVNNSEAEQLQTELGLDDLLYADSEAYYSLKSGRLLNRSEFPYDMNGLNEVMTMNALFALASVQEHIEVKTAATALKGYQIPEYYGRMVVYRRGDQTVVLDFAHEIESLSRLTMLIESYHARKPYLVVRVGSSRTDQSVREFAENFSGLTSIAGATVYDIIDGEHLKAYTGRHLQRNTGETADLVIETMKNAQTAFPVHSVLREQEALQEAVAAGHPLIIHIHHYLDETVALLKSLGFKRVL
ncbi:MAG: UDP-N-acetylmuramoyl-L-alanyl-D-glutamate--2,6-diaminopimelate ligase [candidate division WS6 bacterium OLB20]|uniref:UDP-N-acetylmuramoyl-L-alanyl-D-glutamate--2, 6-diaminopimelate ligase n=1 Tax=candidate division WS6 bacterium OLB20 TaxID=1617426 RepID=A0A136LYD9_9BACT|nr:MAG: UDP-N-acetylmuramoyl-L-alanyl-D-glutamate--2,6-diaminopimelate ligase [candidate division WS6 bacterium OLB20]